MTTLNSIIETAINLTPKPKVDKTLPKLQFEDIQGILEKQMKEINDIIKGDDMYEIEIRLGMITHNNSRIGKYDSKCHGAVINDYNFINGVSKDDFEMLFNTYKKNSTRTTSTNYIYNNKIRYNIETGKIQQKIKVYETNIHIPCSKYDIRISVAKEVELFNFDIPNHYVSYRKKDRISIQRPNSVIDITKVNENEPTSSYEVEIEVTNNKHINSQQLFDVLIEVLSLDYTSNDCILYELNDEIASYNAKQIARMNNCFSGVMPINIRRNHLNTVLNVDSYNYYVSEKTDGVRYIMVTLTDMTVFIDRKGNTFTVNNSKKIVDIIGHECVLDGEIVYNRSWKRYVYIVFDCIKYNDELYTRMKLTDRLEVLQNKILSKYHVDKNMDTLPIIMKHFYPVSRINEITKCINNNIYYEKDKRHHKCDGLIFIEDDLTNRTCLKWKFLNDISIDLKCTYDKSKDMFMFSYYNENGDIDFTKHVEIDNITKYRLHADMKKSNSIIVELQWYNCKWIYKCPRFDKNKANYSDIVLSTLMEIADNIDIDELTCNKNKRIKIR